METPPDASSSSALTLAACFLTRSRLRFTRKFYPLALPCVYAYAFLAAVKTGLQRQPLSGTETVRALREMSARAALGWETDSR